MVDIDHFSERRRGIDMCPWSPSKVWKRIYGPSRVRKRCFQSNLGHLGAIFCHLKFSRKINILAILSPKPLEKCNYCTFQAQKKGATMHFKHLKILFLKNSDKVDDFCTLYDSLTPNTKKFRGGTLTSVFLHFVVFCWYRKQQLFCHFLQ